MHFQDYIFPLHKVFPARNVLTDLSELTRLFELPIMASYCLIHFDSKKWAHLTRFTEYAYMRVLECREIYKTLNGKQRGRSSREYSTLLRWTNGKIQQPTHTSKPSKKLLLSAVNAFSKTKSIYALPGVCIICR